MVNHRSRMALPFKPLFSPYWMLSLFCFVVVVEGSVLVNSVKETTFVSDVVVNGHLSISNEPMLPTHAVTKKYFDASLNQRTTNPLESPRFGQFLSISTLVPEYQGGNIGAFYDEVFIYFVPYPAYTNPGFLRMRQTNYSDIEVARFVNATSFQGGFTDGLYAYYTPHTLSTPRLVRIPLNDFTNPDAQQSVDLGRVCERYGFSYNLAKRTFGGVQQGRYAYIWGGTYSYSSPRVAFVLRLDLLQFTEESTQLLALQFADSVPAQFVRCAVHDLSSILCTLEGEGGSHYVFNTNTATWSNVLRFSSPEQLSGAHGHTITMA